MYIYYYYYYYYYIALFQWVVHPFDLFLFYCATPRTHTHTHAHAHTQTQNLLGSASLVASSLLVSYFVLFQRWGSKRWTKFLGLPSGASPDAKWLWRFPRPQITMLAFSQLLFFVFRMFGSVESLDFRSDKKMFEADFFWWVGAWG